MGNLEPKKILGQIQDFWKETVDTFDLFEQLEKISPGSAGNGVTDTHSLISHNINIDLFTLVWFITLMNLGKSRAVSVVIKTEFIAAVNTFN